MKRNRVLLFALCILFALRPLPAAALDYSGSASWASGKYAAALQNVTLTGNARADITAIAHSQIGYQEGGNSSQLSGEIKGSGNYTEYGRWYGLQDMWCAMFVSWCAFNAGVPTSVVPKHSFTVSGLNQFIAWGRAHTRAEAAAGVYTPQAGDIIYFKSSRNQNKTNHVGIVTGYSGSTVYTIEGNTSSAEISTNGGAVCAKSYSITNTYIVYICCPDYTGTGDTPQPSGAYFPACGASCTTITQGLGDIGVDASYANRKVIAAANGMSDYSGTAEQNTALLDLLKAGRLINPDGAPQVPQAVYFPACAASCMALAAALESVGADGSYAYRKQIAAANGIENYSGTVDQNNTMLALLKAGTLKRPADNAAAVTYFTACESTYTSLVDALRSIGTDSSLAYRKEIAAANGIADYTGTATQNTQMLDLLKAGMLIIPGTAGESACGCGSAYTEHVILAETCTEAGTEYDRCTKCGAVSNRVTIPAVGHTYVHTQTDATCTEAGADIYTCPCGDAYSTPIAPPGHDFDASVSENVTIANGTKTVRCSRCDASLTNTPGDVNRDGSVDLRDVVLLQRMLANWNVSADKTNADVNADASVDLRDAVLIARHLAGGWNVTLLFAL